MGRVIKDLATAEKDGLLVESNKECTKSVPLFPIAPNESRKYQRYYFRSLATATIHPPVGEPDGRPQVCFMMTKDLSRSGVSVLHPVPLFESQRIDLEFVDGRKLSLAIQWVRQLEAKLFMMGCRFVEIDKKAGGKERKAKGPA